MPGPLKEKFAKKADQSRQVADLMSEGDQFRKSGQLVEARHCYSKAMAMSPDNPDLHHRLAIVADQQQQYAMADEHYQAALRLRPRDAKLLNDMGYSAYLRGNTQQAEVILREALSIDRNHRLAMANLGMIYAQQNRYDDALEMFRNGMPEGEAQQSVAQLFSQNQNMVASNQPPNQTYSNSNSAASTPPRNNSRNLSDWTQAEVQAEMARVGQESKQRRIREDEQRMNQYRNMIAEDEKSQQQQISQAMKSNQRLNNDQVVMVGPQGSDGAGAYQGQQNMQAGSPPAGQSGAAYVNPNQNPAMGSMSWNNDSNAVNGMPNDRSANSRTADSSPAGPPQMARIFRGTGGPNQQSRTNDPQFQQVRDQRGSAAASNNQQQSNGYNNACLMAAQLGMSAGPGSMFPVMQGSDSDMGTQRNPGYSRNNQFGAELQPSLDSQYPQSQNSNGIEQTSNRASMNSGNDQQLPPIAPMSPANNWSSPGVSPFNWQNDSRASSDWSTETIPTNVPQINTNNQYSIRRGNGFDSLQPGQNTIQPRNDIDATRPYNGTWPNTNSLPQRQNSNIQINARSPETMEIMGINPNSDAGGSASQGFNGYNGSSSDGAGNSVPMYPYAPNR
jgi:Tfp pilus assembly protein PilF